MAYLVIMFSETIKALAMLQCVPTYGIGIAGNRQEMQHNTSHLDIDSLCLRCHDSLFQSVILHIPKQ